MFDVIGPKSANQSGAVTPWMHTLAVGKDIFDMYESRGDHVSAAAIYIPSVQDGPGVVVRYNNLTLNHVLSTTNRNRSLTVLVDGDLVINNGGGISMTARGARGNAGMGLYDAYIPTSIDLTSRYLLLADVLKYIKDNSIDVTDHWFWDDFAKNMGVVATFNQGGALVLLTAVNCGAGVSGNTGGNVAGTVGTAGANGAPGAGGAGGGYTGNLGGPSGPARPWGGGPGGCCTGALSTVGTSADLYCGHGGIGTIIGGPGNPGGGGTVTGSDGTGGILRIIVKGSVTINSGGIVQADGVAGSSGASNSAGGSGGSGGGHVSIIYGGTYTNNGTVRANGGAGGAGYGGLCNGGAGGAGSVVTKTFAQMGW